MAAQLPAHPFFTNSSHEVWALWAVQGGEGCRGRRPVEGIPGVGPCWFSSFPSWLPQWFPHPGFRISLEIPPSCTVPGAWPSELRGSLQTQVVCHAAGNTQMGGELRWQSSVIWGIVILTQRCPGSGPTMPQQAPWKLNPPHCPLRDGPFLLGTGLICSCGG